MTPLALVLALAAAITTTYPVDFTIPLPCGVTPEDTMNWKGPLVVSAPADGSTSGVTADAREIVVRTGSGAVYAVTQVSVHLDATGAGTFTFALRLRIAPDIVRALREETRAHQLEAATLRAEAQALREAAQGKRLAAREMLNRGHDTRDLAERDALLAAAHTLEAEAAAQIQQSKGLRARARQDGKAAHAVMREARNHQAAAHRLERPVVVRGEATVVGGRLGVKLVPPPSPCR